MIAKFYFGRIYDDDDNDGVKYRQNDGKSKYISLAQKIRHPHSVDYKRTYNLPDYLDSEMIKEISNDISAFENQATQYFMERRADGSQDNVWIHTVYYKIHWDCFRINCPWCLKDVIVDPYKRAKLVVMEGKQMNDPELLKLNEKYKQLHEKFRQALISRLTKLRKLATIMVANTMLMSMNDLSVVPLEEEDDS